ncbi:hypothetical protein ACRE_008280 [Hapsidospora chrysogenum ATCC 11550]|uniref:Uncharacterized protein n=1 Tax=Hapsidospora chrysogenum (strain ATCC 11550 / CBS 779.69 / DSM 880 / IAM 14645 / JCM 23072 / IMI 49137) TaxID=857340 RepID=A0A086TFV4_HAPC1|nr:hypothetical protein ACRE_008280 [Hapsidospora chrysogenum ATCC 11550]
MSTTKPLATLGVSVGDLSFTTGQTHDGSDQFIQPILLEEIDQALTQIRPLEAENAHYKTMSILGHGTNLWQARYICSFFDDLLGKRVKMGRSLASFANTAGRGEGETISDKCDPSIPHKKCYLLYEARLRDGVLSASELMAILSIPASRLLAEKYRHHRVFPVTLLTASGTKVRVTQGHVDGKRRSVKVYMTRTIDFVEGHEKNWNEVLTVLSWLLGKPTGITT